MLKYVSSIVLTALLSFIAGLFLPWWSIAVASFLVSILIPQRPVMSFLAGFLGVFLLWEILAWRIDANNSGILSHKIANILPLGGSAVFLIVLSSILGALVAGSAALAGAYARRWIVKTVED
jgi:hypothetical protein